MVSNIKLSNLLCGGGGTKIIFCPAGFCAIIPDEVLVHVELGQNEPSTDTVLMADIGDTESEAVNIFIAQIFKCLHKVPRDA